MVLYSKTVSSPAFTCKSMMQGVFYAFSKLDLGIRGFAFHALWLTGFKTIAQIARSLVGYIRSFYFGPFVIVIDKSQGFAQSSL